MFLIADSLVHDLLVVLFGTGLASVLAWFIGSRVGDFWDERKRRRESDLAALATFYQVYGEFFATWKLWAAHKDSQTTRFKYHVVPPDHVQWRLLERGASAEGRFEALLIKLVSERQLSLRDRRLLGCFREGYQMLREQIGKDKPLNWWSSGTSPGAEQYAAFKSLAEYVALVLQAPASTRPSEHDAINALREISLRTEFHGAWPGIAAKELGLEMRDPVG